MNIMKVNIGYFSKKIVFLAFFFCLFFYASSALASETNGTIDGTYKHAWGENIGWLNFGCDNCDVVITDSGLTGNVWSAQYGWINLSPDQTGNTGVLNTSEGTLSGFAWSSNLGWIDFDGVTINSSGEFLGYATVESDGGQINFNCINGNSCSGADFKVKTDWRPASVRVTTTPSVGGSSGFLLPTPPVVPLPPIVPVLPPAITPVIKNPLISVIDNTGENINSFFNSILNFFRPKNQSTETPILVEIPKITPISFKMRWNLLPVKAIRTFVFAPLPYEVRVLASKFPELDRTLKSVNVKRLTDLNKLTGINLYVPDLADVLNTTIKNVGLKNLSDIDKLNKVSLSVPGLSSVNGTLKNNVGAGKITLIKGLPIAKFSLVAKKNLPAEFVFARTGAELVDLNVVMSINDKGGVTQTISSLPGKTLKLVVKPISNARSVTGYFIFKSATPRISKTEIYRSSLTASALFSMNDLVENVSSPISVENKLVLSSFEYEDLDGDGIYTADVFSPSVPGEYEVVTIIDYIDQTLGARQMRMTTVIDPEGYVYEKNNGKETRIPSAIVSFYSLNNVTKKYELWSAKDYQQENPQITDVRGTYSFLVPEGSYYFLVEAPGYNSYQGKVFVVAEGAGIHQNIELKSGRGFFTDLDWKTLLLIVVFLLLVYNLYRNSLRDKLLKFADKNNNDGK